MKMMKKRGIIVLVIALASALLLTSCANIENGEDCQIYDAKLEVKSARTGVITAVLKNTSSEMQTYRIRYDLYDSEDNYLGIATTITDIFGGSEATIAIRLPENINCYDVKRIELANASHD
ncbi:MAG: hypothetical protein HFJ64_07340 [Eggerthellaceae bacterium]|uniref:hypothetical protein n=1 Tax=Dubosiella newyorkensis TaxID=1862672 RepID=UPI00259D09E0|nr:hypothetical protein [Dubosiella newyorkensis]MCI9629012.1 hypothetical protein [Eggerthellaceae bacterium]